VRGFASYLLAGVLVVLVLDFIAPPAGVGVAIGAWPAAPAPAIQSVDRTNKGNRMPLPMAVDKHRAPVKSPTLLAGCEPVFSPLSASARANFAGRCVA
jgi:hypothetical protein